VNVTLSKGSPKVKVPTVAGLSLAEAQITLSGFHLRVGRQSLISSQESRNTVLGQFPVPDSSVDSTSDVDLLVSTGPLTATFVMPDLQYQPLEKAFKTLRPADINIEKISREVHDDLESETVLSQTPPAGTNIQGKDSVSFVVSAKSADANIKTRYSKVVFDMPAGSPKRLQIDVFDSTGTRIIYNKMESPKNHIEVGTSVTGKAFAEIYLNQHFIQEIPIE
jgi:beta-lactam-binding protein with PASTA domain